MMSPSHEVFMIGGMRLLTLKGPAGDSSKYSPLSEKV